MRLFDAESTIIQDIRDESEVIAAKDHQGLKVTAARHPTLGKVVIVEGADGRGVIVETEE